MVCRTNVHRYIIGERELVVRLARFFYIVRRVHIVHMRMRGNYVKRLRDICTVCLGAFAIYTDAYIEERPWRQPRAGDASSLALSSIYT